MKDNMKDNMKDEGREDELLGRLSRCLIETDDTLYSLSELVLDGRENSLLSGLERLQGEMSVLLAEWRKHNYLVEKYGSEE